MIRMALEVSMKQPTISSRMLTSSRNVKTDRFIPVSVSVICAGIRSEVSTNVNRIPLAMMNMIIADVFAEPSRMPPRSLMVISR